MSGLDADNLRIAYTEGAFAPNDTQTVLKYPRDYGQSSLGMEAVKVFYDYSTENSVSGTILLVTIATALTNVKDRIFTCNEKNIATALVKDRIFTCNEKNIWSDIYILTSISSDVINNVVIDVLNFCMMYL